MQLSVESVIPAFYRIPKSCLDPSGKWRHLKIVSRWSEGVSAFEHTPFAFFFALFYFIGMTHFVKICTLTPSFLISVSYDTLGRVSSVANNLGVFNSTFMGASGRVAQIDYPTGSKVFSTILRRSKNEGAGCKMSHRRIVSQRVIRASGNWDRVHFREAGLNTSQCFHVLASPGARG